MIVLMFGPPGCGKGTQASFIARRFRICAISTGDLLRAELQAGTALGRRASAILAQGGLVGDEIVNPLVAARLSNPNGFHGFLLDGYPRRLGQAEFLDGLLRETGLPAPVVIHLDVPPTVLVRRIVARRQCPRCAKIYNLLSQPPRLEGVCDADGARLISRPDDTEAVVRERLKAYQELTGPVIAHYRKGRYHRLNGNRSPEEVRQEIERLIESESGRMRRRPLRMKPTPVGATI